METHRIEALERLGRLLDDGKISRTEYESLKNDLLTRTDNPPLHRDGMGSGIASDDVGPDFYQLALEGEIEVDGPGWYPDPDSIGTRTRFYDGRSWTDSVLRRRPAGWYRSKEQPSKERYFNGLEYTDEYRTPTQSTMSRTLTRPLGALLVKDWRFWVGLVLVILGVLAVINGFIRFSEEPIQTVEVFVLSFAIDPLIWGGIIGTFMLYRWRQSNPGHRGANPDRSHARRQRNPFWIDLH